jgi:hypothetical protein
LQSFWSASYLLSFGRLRNDLLLASTNEDQTTPNKILLEYLQNILLGSTTTPTFRSTYWIGNAGLYYVKGLMDDPTYSFFTYLFITDNSVGSGTFGVFKMDFSYSIPNYVYTALSMSSGLGFTVNTLTRTLL